MFTKEKVLGTGFKSASDAYAPLRAVCLSSKCITGEIRIPESDLVYRRGSGRWWFTYKVKALAKADAEGYRVHLYINRLSLVSIGIMVIIQMYYVYGALHRHLVGGPLIVLIGWDLIVTALIINAIFRGAEAAFRDLSRYYN